MSAVGTDCNSMGLYGIPTTTADLPASRSFVPRFVAPTLSVRVSPVLAAPFRAGEQII